MTDPVVRPKRSERAAATRAALSKAALELFAQRGYDKVSVADICREVGVTVGVFYHYYSTKSDVFRQLSLDMDERVRAFQPTSSNALGRIAEITHLSAEITRDIGVDTMSVILTPANHLVYANNLSAKTIRAIVESGQRSGEISAADTPDNQVRMLCTVLWGVTMFWCAEKGSFDLVEHSDDAIAVALKSLAP